MNNLLNIEPCVLENYLIQKGWIMIYDKKSSQIFQDRNAIESVILPIDKTFVDYKRVLNDTLIAVAQYEKISYSELINILLSPPSDMLRFRINNDMTRFGTIPLSNIENVLTNIRDIIFSTAKSIL